MVNSPALVGHLVSTTTTAPHGKRNTRLTGAKLGVDLYHFYLDLQSTYSHYALPFASSEMAALGSPVSGLQGELAATKTK